MLIGISNNLHNGLGKFMIYCYLIWSYHVMCWFNLYCGGFILFYNVCVCVGFVICGRVCVCIYIYRFCNVWVYCNMYTTTLTGGFPVLFPQL